MAARSPFEGLRRFTSAITPTPGARSAASASRAGRASRAAAFTSSNGSSASRADASSRTPATISSRTFTAPPSTFASSRTSPPGFPDVAQKRSPHQPDRWCHSRGGWDGARAGGGESCERPAVPCFVVPTLRRTIEPTEDRMRRLTVALTAGLVLLLTGFPAGLPGAAAATRCNVSGTTVPKVIDVTSSGSYATVRGCQRQADWTNVHVHGPY